MERNPMEMAVSTDIVMEVILKHLKVGDLLNCRLASKFWNTAASSVLRKRRTMITNISDQKDLLKLETCMKQSSDFPFAGLKFDEPWRLDSGCAAEFFQNFGARFTRLRLDIDWTQTLQAAAPFIRHLPRLSILEMGRGWGNPARPAELKDGQILRLPSVQTIRMLGTCLEANDDVLREIFMAASPCVRIECFNAKAPILRVLESVKKLSALSFIEFSVHCEKSEGQLEIDQLFSSQPPSLTKLDFYVNSCISRHGLKMILLASQHTLKEMRLEGMCLFEKSWDEFPVFARLTKLELCIQSRLFSEPLCRGTHGHKFPVLKELQLDVAYERVLTFQTYFSDGLFVVPSVTAIDFAWYFDENGMKLTAQWFPNVTQIRLQHGHYCHTNERGRSNLYEIWNLRVFERLEKLEICGWPVGCSDISMDSLLTGMPQEICESLLRQNKRLDLLSSPFNEVLRVYPNILQLKSLKELDVCLVYGFKPKTKCPTFISMVSVWYALEMMPNLRAKFIYAHHVQAIRNQERHKATSQILTAPLVQPLEGNEWIHFENATLNAHAHITTTRPYGFCIKFYGTFPGARNKKPLRVPHCKQQSF